MNVFKILIASLFILVFFVAVAGASEPQAELQKGYDLYYQGDLLGAYGHFLQMQQQEPENLAAAYGVLSSVYARDKFEDALETEFERRADALLEQAEARYGRDETDAEALFYLAQTYGLRAGYRFERQKNLFGAARDAARSKKLSEAYVRLHPDHADALIALGLYNYYADIAPAVLKFIRYLLLMPGGDKGLGLQQLEEAARRGELWSPQARMELVQIYTWLEGRVTDGLRLAEELHQRYPDNPQLTLRVARLAAGPVLEDLPRAAEHYKEMLRKAEEHRQNYPPAVYYTALLGLAEVRMQQWELEEAVAMLEPVIVASVARPGWAVPRSLLLRARIRALLGDAQALEDVARVEQSVLWKKFHDEAAALRTQLESELGNGQAARRAELAPGNRLIAQKRYHLARIYFEEKLREHPGDLQVRFHLAHLAFLEGQWEQAKSGFESLERRLDRKSPGWLAAETLLHLARLYDLENRRKEAVALYETVQDDYEREPAAKAAQLGLLVPYQKRTQISRR